MNIDNLTENERTVCDLQKENFLYLWEQIEDRPGKAECLRWLENETDFFTAPASTKYHGAAPGGLCAHSLNVCDALTLLLRTWRVQNVTTSSAILVALLHDVCKTNFYTETTTRKRDASGKWYDARGYMIEDSLPMGHGEKALYMVLQTGLKLTNEEAAAIRWHMGAYNDHDKNYTLGAAFDKYPLALYLHMADMIAAHYIEAEG